MEGFNGRAKSRLAHGRLTWQGLENASIHVSIILCVVYAAIAATFIGRPELPIRQLVHHRLEQNLRWSWK